MPGVDAHLTREELAALFNAERLAPPAGPVVEAPQAARFDFRRPEKISKEHEQSLRVILGNFARHMAGTLAMFLRSAVEVELQSLSETSYEEYLAEMPSPSLTAVCSVPPLEGKVFFIIDPRLSLVFVDRLMGGPGDSPSRVREMTQIEVALLRRVMDRVMVSLKEAWSGVMSIDPVVDEMESNPLFVQPVSATEPVVVAGFSVSLRMTRGQIRLCMPYHILKPIIPRLREQLWFDDHGKPGDKAEPTPEVRRHLMNVPLTIGVRLGEAVISVAELLDLQVGDCVVLNTQEGDELPAMVGGRTQLWGRLGVAGRAYAIAVTRWESDTPEGWQHSGYGGDTP